MTAPEADAIRSARNQYLEAAAELPGLVGYAYDRALRGVHLDRLLKAGHIGLVGVHKQGGKARDRYHGVETHHPASGPSTSVEIHLAWWRTSCPSLRR